MEWHLVGMGELEFEPGQAGFRLDPRHQPRNPVRPAGDGAVDPLRGYQKRALDPLLAAKVEQRLPEALAVGDRREPIEGGDRERLI